MRSPWVTFQTVRLHTSLTEQGSVNTCAVDLEQAYARIGYTKEYATAITVEADEAPDDEILKMHRDSTQRAGNPSERAEVSQALKMIGIHRKNSMMERLGGTGQSIMSVDEAFSALSAPRDSIDDGLIM